MILSLVYTQHSNQFSSTFSSVFTNTLHFTLKTQAVLHCRLSWIFTQHSLRFHSTLSHVYANLQCTCITYILPLFSYVNTVSLHTWRILQHTVNLPFCSLTTPSSNDTQSFFYLQTTSLNILSIHTNWALYITHVARDS